MARDSQVAESADLALLVEVVASDLHAANREHRAVRAATARYRESVRHSRCRPRRRRAGSQGRAHSNISSFVAVVSVMVGPSHM